MPMYLGTIVRVHCNSIRQWINDYLAYGLDSLLQINYGTNTSIPEQQAGSIMESFTTQPPRSISEAALRAKALTGVERSPTRLRTFIKRHQFRFFKTGHIPAKVNTTQ